MHTASRFMSSRSTIDLENDSASRLQTKPFKNYPHRALEMEIQDFAVDAAMTGRTDGLIGHLHDEFVHVPLSAAISQKKRLDTEQLMWATIVRDTGQTNW